ncbi:MAG TPA: DUF4214 domain-containing protein, partial [Telluria sp.]|nr:DUF4214 domain-containing protein [Telluria sp.]
TDSLGADKLNGAAGDDTLVSSLGGTDQLNGGPGNDVLTMRAPSAGTLDGGAGNDTLTAVLMPNVLEVGGDGNDQLLVNGGGGILSGGAGNDTLTAQDSDTVLLDGGDGNDTFINQGSRHTSATGGPGRDNFKLGTYYEINDFATGANGDIVVLPTDVLANGDPFGPNGKLILVQDGADALIQLNDDLLAPSTLARLHNVDPARLTLDNNNLHVDWHFHSSLPSNGADRLLGTQDGETIDAGTGNDTLIGGGGDDLLVGGAGTDTARYLGNSANFTVTRDDGGLHLLDRTGVEGTDTLVGIERLQFADKAVALDVDGAAGQAYRLYRAAFDRAPDAAGLGFWIAAIDQGRSLKSIAGGFIGSSEFSNLYSGDSTNARVVDHLYQNVLHRTPDAAGRTFWIGVLDAHTATLPEVLVALSESGENTQAVAELIGLGVDYTPYNG